MNATHMPYDDENIEHQQPQKAVSEWQQDNDLTDPQAETPGTRAVRELREKLNAMPEEEYSKWVCGEWKREVAP